MQKILATILFCILLAHSTSAEALTPPHKFFDARNLIGISVMAAGLTLDAHSSCRFLSRGAHEANPIMPKTCKGITWAMIAQGVGFTGLAYLFHQAGKKNSDWHNLERLSLYVIGLEHGIVAGLNYRF